MSFSLVFVILGLFAMLGVVASLLFGLFSMSRGRKADHKASNKMMQMRIVLQALALLFFFLATMAK